MQKKTKPRWTAFFVGAWVDFGFYPTSNAEITTSKNLIKKNIFFSISRSLVHWLPCGFIIASISRNMNTPPAMPCHAMPCSAQPAQVFQYPVQKDQTERREEMSKEKKTSENIPLLSMSSVSQANIIDIAVCIYDFTISS